MRAVERRRRPWRLDAVLTRISLQYGGWSVEAIAPVAEWINSETTPVEDWAAAVEALVGEVERHAC